jgi:hypothetical protein
MLACVLFVQEWRIEFEMKREVGVVVSDGGQFRMLCKTQDTCWLVFYLFKNGE